MTTTSRLGGHGKRPAGDGKRRPRTVPPGEVLAAIPAWLGFRPSPGEDLIFIGGREAARKPTEARAFLRRGLPDPRNPVAWHTVMNRTAMVLAMQDYNVMTVVGYGPDSRVAPLAPVLRQAAVTHGVRLADFFRVQDGRYWCCLCQDPDCCSPAGTDYTGDEEAAALLPSADQGLASRDAVAASIAPAGGAAMRAATSRARDRAARLAPDTAEKQGRQAVADAVARYRAGGPELTCDEAARIVAELRDPGVRDVALRQMNYAGREAHQRLWAGLTRLAPPGYAAAPASLLAFTAWQAGNGALANRALARALDDDPGDHRTLTLLDIIGSGLTWQEARRLMSPELAALWGEDGGP